MTRVIDAVPEPQVAQQIGPRLYRSKVAGLFTTTKPVQKGQTMEEKETPKFLQKIYGATISRTELWITIAIVIAFLAFFPG